MRASELQAEVQRLRAENGELRLRLGQQATEIAELRTQLGELRSALEEALRAGKRQATPFRRDPNRLKRDPKRPGRKAGEGEFNYQQLDENADVESEPPAELTGCPICNKPVTEVKEHEQFVREIPEPKVIWHRLVTYSGWCACCNKRVRSRHPLQTSSATGAAGVMLGPRIIALASDMKHRFGVSYDKIAEFLLSAYGLKVTGGGLLDADQRLARRARPVYETLIELIRRCSVVHADETGWRIGQLSAWMWVFTNQRITLFAIRAGPGARGHEVILSILGREFAGTLVADGFLAYDAKALADWIHQKCLAHILKNLKTMSESRQAASLAVASEATAALRAALALRNERATLDADSFAARRADIVQRIDVLAAAYVDRPAYDDAGRMARHLTKHRDHLFRFLDDPAVDATNNAAERDIRPAVITRKTGGCNRTKEGADNHAILASIVVTLRKNDVDVHAYLTALQRDAAPAIASLIKPAAVPATAR